MKILKVQTLRGANIWSSSRKNVIQMRLDLEDMEKRPTNLIAGFKERLERPCQRWRSMNVPKVHTADFSCGSKKAHGWDTS